MTDFTGKSWMAIGETDDPNAIIESYEAAADVTKGDPVYLSADNKVSPAAAAQDCIGVAVKSAASGEQCPVLTRGRVKVKAGDAITRGKAVLGADASKRVIELTDQVVDESGSVSYIVYYNRKLGIALETTTAADVLHFIAESADKTGVIGFDFRVAPDGKFEFFPRNSRASAVSLSEKIEHSEYRKDIHRVRNRVAVYGVADKSVPLDKDAWTESLTPADGAWTATSGTVSFDSAAKVKGSGSIKTYTQNLNYGGCLLTLDAGKEVDAEQYPVLNLWLNRESSFNGNVTLTLFDGADRMAGHEFTVGHEKWFQTQVRVGAANADMWQVENGFDWTQIKKVRVVCWFDGVSTGSFWVDCLFFGGRRYNAVQEDSGSQSSYGLRELVEVDEELWNDDECTARAKASLANLKAPVEQLTLRSTVIDYGATPLLPGDKVHITLPNEGVDGDFRMLSIEYYVDAKTQTLETLVELGREQPLLADYMFRLKSKTDSLSRYKLARV